MHILLYANKGRLKKINSKMNDIVQKEGEVSEKKSNFESMNKSDILLREGGGAKLMSFFKDVFKLSLDNFLAHPLAL